MTEAGICRRLSMERRESSVIESHSAACLTVQRGGSAVADGLGSSAGIWEGIATYLTIISGYVEAFRGRGINLPDFVTRSARFSVGPVYYRRDFLRVPIVPYSLNLYAAELRKLVLRGELSNSLRLSLLPGLATAAALELKLTGSDKGIW